MVLTQLKNQVYKRISHLFIPTKYQYIDWCHNFDTTDLLFDTIIDVDLMMSYIDLHARQLIKAYPM